MPPETGPSRGAGRGGAARAPGRLARAGAWLRGAALLAVAAAAVPSPAAAATARTAADAAAGCSHPVARPQGPFRIAAGNRAVLSAGGTPFVSYGTTVPGLSQPTFAAGQASFVTGVVRGKDIPKISATARQWCGNTVRLQVSQHDVTQNTTPQNGSCASPAALAFLARALDPEVRAAEAAGLAVVINDQTESDPLAREEKDPTGATLVFWDCVARHRETWGRHLSYAQDPDVILDIFNEPRADDCTSQHGPYDLSLWRNGGPGPCGPRQPDYLGMEAVASHLRASDGARNLLWVEGPGAASTLAGLTGGCGTSPACLISANLGPVVYSVHHPFVASAAQANPATWGPEFGYLTGSAGGPAVAPVVAGEWTNIDAGNAAPGHPVRAYCWPDAPRTVPAFLRYLQSIGAGMSAYQLSAGRLLKGSGQWTLTTNYTDDPWANTFCAYHGYGALPPLLGAGADILAWFRQQD